MANKHHREKPERTPTRRQLSKWKRQRRLARIVTIVSIVFFLIIVGLIGYGYYSEQIMPYQRIALKVNDATFNMDYYIKAYDLFTRGSSIEMIPYYQDIVIKAIQQGEIVRAKAGDVGISVADDEINSEIERSKLTKSDVVYDVAKASVLSQKIINQICLPKQPAGVEQVEVQAMFLETKAMADDRRAKLLLGDNFSASAGLLSLEPTTQASKGYLGWVAKGYEQYTLNTLSNSALKDVIFELTPGVVSQPIYDTSVEKPFGYWVVEVLEKDDTKGVHARGILCSTRDEGEEVKKKLADGESFEDLAKQYSQHASNDKGGDLGWIVPGMNKEILGRMLASLEPHTISEVIRDESVKTKGGYWLVQILNKEDNRPLDDKIKQMLSEQCLSEWIAEQLKSAKVEVLLDQQQKDWVVEKVKKMRSKRS